MYLVGFKTQGGSWYAFKNRNHLIQGSTALTFSDDYKSLTGGGSYKNLVNVVVGKNSAEEAWGFWPSTSKGSTTDQETKKALLRFVLMFSEAARFQLIRVQMSAQHGIRSREANFARLVLTSPSNGVSFHAPCLSHRPRRNGIPSRKIKRLRTLGSHR